MSMPIVTAMVLAAGLGTRMRPYTDNMPKPLVPVLKKPLIDYTLDRFAEAGVKRAIVNTHYLAEQLQKHLEKRTAPQILVSDERGELLETGGALIKARDQLGDEPFFCANTDAIMIDTTMDACEVLTGFWQDHEMDALLLLCPKQQTSGYTGKGDFLCTADGVLSWPDAGAKNETAYIFTGVQIIHPRLFADEPLRPVSTKRFWDKAMAEGRLYGVLYDGRWMHVGDPAGLAAAEKYLSST